jgi:DNA-directed RNA polymerase alpha subunit
MYQKVECNDLFHPETIQKLCSSGVVYVGDLVSSDAFTLMKKAKLSVSETEDLVEVLAARGLTLGMHIPGWPPESFDLDERAKQSSKRQQLVEINIKTSPR